MLRSSHSFNRTTLDHVPAHLLVRPSKDGSSVVVVVSEQAPVLTILLVDCVDGSHV